MPVIKRDTIQRFRITTTDDEQGGQKIEYTPLEYITVAASITSVFETMNQFGVKKSFQLSVVSDAKLDEYVNTRYEYSGHMYKLTQQLKRGNEYFSTFVEVNE